MRAILRYTDCLGDGKNVFQVLSRRNVDILQTKRKTYSIHPQITVFVDSSSELNELLNDLNKTCIYEVSIVKTSKSSSCDSCGQRDCCPTLKRAWHTFVELFASPSEKQCDK